MGVLGSLLASLSQRMVRTGTMALMVSGAGLAGYSYYLDQQASAAGMSSQLEWVKGHATWFIAVGVAGMVVGFVLNAVTARNQMSRMMRGMPSGMGMQGMPGIGMQSMEGMGLQGMPGREVVKVRCPACSSLEAESAAFCSKCGKPMV